jgi:hypothetical protein
VIAPPGPGFAVGGARPGPAIPRGRLVLLATGGLALLGGLTGALVLLGLPMPSGVVPLAADHGELMALGFLGTVIALERAVAVGSRWGFASPALAALGAMLLLAGRPHEAAVLLAGAAACLLAVYAAFARTDRSLQMGVQAAGAGAWLAAAGLLAFGVPVATVTPWLAAFLVMTVAGERLDLARLGSLDLLVRRRFVAATLLFVAGVTASLAAPDIGVRVAGLGLLAMAMWLVRHDLARRTVRIPGVTRYIALCLLAGYAWLAVDGIAWAATGLAPGAAYDARLHALFLGFVISMVFGHAPVIVPAVLRVPLPYRPRFYAQLVLLHVGLAIRVFGGDLLGVHDAFVLGGILGVVALLVFVGSSAAASIGEIQRRRSIQAARARLGGGSATG